MYSHSYNSTQVLFTNYDLQVLYSALPVCIKPQSANDNLHKIIFTANSTI